MSFVHELLKDSSSIVNSVLGDLCVYRNKDGDEREIYVTIDRNIEMFNEYGLLAGYRIEAAICKSDVQDLLIGCHLTDEENVLYRINAINKDTVSKYYVSLVVENADL